MARTLLLSLPAALLLAAGWLRIEQPRSAGDTAAWIIVLALAPALARPWRARAALALVAAVAAGHAAFGIWAIGGRHDPGRLGSRFGNGFLNFYDNLLPIDPAQHPWMHGVLLVAIFGFTLALSLAVAARRATVAVLVLLVGAGWPATLYGGGAELGRGVLVLAAALAILAGLSQRVGRPALAAAGIVLVGALLASSSPAVAKTELFHWQAWDFYTRPQEPVSVRFVWNADYGGLRFPHRATTVLRIHAGPASRYWRATTLDDFIGGRWVEDLRPTLSQPELGGRASADPLLPPPARSRRAWVHAEVEVGALVEDRLVGGSVPVAYDAGTLGPLLAASDGVAMAVRGLHRGDRYTASSWAPAPTPARLARSAGDYPPELIRDGRYLRVQDGIAMPPFGAPGRAAQVGALFRDPLLSAYAPLLRQALGVVGRPRTPYPAVVALESWFRSTGGFRYDERPPATPGLPPLVGFATRTHAGYCQHFAGAMTLMLRYLGIPARVAAGFTSGRYDAKRGLWTVTDRDAHTWVEVWFAGYGWLPFDPTPGRGVLSGAYTSASPSFDAAAAAKLLALAARGVVDAFDFKQDHSFGEKPADAGTVGGADVRRNPGGRVVRTVRRNGSLLRLAGLLALALLSLVVAAKKALHVLRRATRDPRRLAGALRLELVDFLVDQRVPVERSATLHELGAAVSKRLAVDAAPFVASASEARFGPEATAPRAAAEARADLAELRRQLRSRLSLVDRARGLVSLRSLGFA